MKALPSEVWFVMNSLRQRPIGFAGLDHYSEEVANSWIARLAKPLAGDPLNPAHGWKAVRYVEAN